MSTPGVGGARAPTVEEVGADPSHLAYMTEAEYVEEIRNQVSNGAMPRMTQFDAGAAVRASSHHDLSSNRGAHVSHVECPFEHWEWLLLDDMIVPTTGRQAYRLLGFNGDPDHDQRYLRKVASWLLFICRGLRLALTPLNIDRNGICAVDDQFQTFCWRYASLANDLNAWVDLGRICGGSTATSNHLWSQRCL